MIRSFACRETQRLFEDETSRRLPSEIQRVARRKLLVLNQARNLNDLRSPPGNRLEPLKADRAGQHIFGLMIDGGFAFDGKTLTLTTLRS
jgi:proteic killer suppression protein